MSITEPELRSAVDEILNRWPTAGLAVAVLRSGSPDFLYRRGVADVPTRTPVTLDTVFRIGSITKTMTAIAIMQLWEQQLVDLDAPANDYLRSYALVPAKSTFQPATVRHLLTHTAGVRAVRRVSDLLRPELGWGVRGGRPVPLPPEYYKGGLRIDVEPGTRWAYTNHGFTTLGQIVEDVSGIALERYLRERVFDPLGMASSELVRSERVRSHLATGYSLGSRGLQAVADHEIAVVGGGSVYSTVRDMARYATALLGGGTNDHGTVLKPQTLSLMFEPHFQPDSRIPGMGLGFFRNAIGGHQTVWHDGIWKGFLSDMVLAPADQIGVLAFANTGGFNHRGAPVAITSSLLPQLLGVADDTLRTDVPEQPSHWSDLCGWYSFGPGFLTDPQPRLMLGAGVEVVVNRGQLTIRGQTPVPAVRRGLRLYPDGDDPYAFRVDFSAIGSGTSPIIFHVGPDGEVSGLCLGIAPMSFRKQPNYRNPRPWVNGAAVCAAMSLGVTVRGKRRQRRRSS